MRRIFTLVSLLPALALTPAGGADFEHDFTGATLRVDYYHSGTATEEHVALDRVRLEGPWPGSRTRLLDTTNLGKYLVEVVGLDSNRVLYSRGFASIFGEWETTGEASAGEWKTLPEAVRIPEPARPFQLRLRKRGEDGVFREIWSSAAIDPRSRFVDRAPARTADVRTWLEGGDPATRVDLLILGDGYAEDEIERFDADTARLVEALFAVEPFASRRGDFNVRSIRTPSPGSGITRPRAGAFRETPLKTRYNSFDSERYVLTLDDRAWRDIAAAAPYDTVLILVNERKYGGGGIFNLYATAAASSGFAEYLVIHEFGHSFAGLGDEYFTSSVAYEESAGAPTEPWEPNLTTQTDRAKLKWGDLVADGTPVPTPWNKERYEAESRTRQQKRAELRTAGAPEEKLEALFREERRIFTPMLGDETHANEVGAFEGAGYRATGLYRPQADCIMFTRDDVGFCAVCSRAIERVIDLYSR